MEESKMGSEVRFVMDPLNTKKKTISVPDQRDPLLGRPQEEPMQSIYGVSTIKQSSNERK